MDEESNAVLTGELIGKRLRFQAVPCCVHNHKSSYSVRKTPNVSHNVWHKRLAHINSQYLSRMNDNNLVEGMYITFVDDFVYESCNLCKITRKPHKVIMREQSTRPLELTHGDVCGPLPTESLNGSRYMFVLIDDFSGMYFTYFMKHKNEINEKLVLFKEKYENLLGVRIKRFITDNGREFVNRELDEFLGRNGISHEKTVPYNPESNGKAERANRTILERTKILLYDSKLPNTFWAEAAACASYISNVTLRKRKNKTPFELFYGAKPNIDYLRVFGCIVYFHIPKQKRDKLDLPDKIGIMIGYARERRGYGIYEPETRQILEERSVNFNENESGERLISDKDGKDNEYSIFTHLEPEYDTDSDRSDNETDADINDQTASDEENNGIVEVGRKPLGRPRGTTRAVIEARKHLRREEDSATQTEVRRSERLREKATTSLVEHNETPSNYNEAMNSENWPDWERAMREELKLLETHSVWDIVDRPSKCKITKSKWVLTTKRGDKNGSVKYKARLVTAGFNYVKHKDFEESFSPVVSIKTWRLFVALAN